MIRRIGCCFFKQSLLTNFNPAISKCATKNISTLFEYQNCQTFNNTLIQNGSVRFYAKNKDKKKEKGNCVMYKHRFNIKAYKFLLKEKRKSKLTKHN